MIDEIGPNGLRLIKEFEGLRLRSYRDVAGIWTIGYGHITTAGPDMQIDEAGAEALLIDDLKSAEHAVRTSFARKSGGLTQNEFDALVSFAFNLGSGALSRSTLRRVILVHGTADEIAHQFNRWNKARVNGQLTVVAGLTRRREAEARLYTEGVYP